MASRKSDTDRNAMAAQVMSKRAQKKQDNASKNTTPLVMTKKFWYGLVALFLFCGIGVLQFGLMLSDMVGKAGSGGSAAGVVYVDVTTEEEKLKEAFFGGDPYVLYCTGDKTEKQPTPKVVVDIAKLIQKDNKYAATNFIVANCFKPMKGSGKTIAERFSFGKNEAFLAVFANEDPPLQLNYLQNAEYVAKQIKPRLKFGIQKIVYKKDWDKIKKKRSFMLLGGSTTPRVNNMFATLSPEVKNFRKTKIATVDTSFWQINTDEELQKKLPVPTEESEFGTAMCIVRERSGNAEEDDEEVDDGGNAKEAEKTEEEKRQEAKKAFKDGKKEDAKKHEKKKGPTKKYRVAYLQSWEGDAPRAFLEQCNNGGDASWTVTEKRPDVRVIPSKPKVVMRPGRKSNEDASKSAGAEDVGLKKGGKERVGRRLEDVEKDDADEDEDFEEFDADEGKREDGDDDNLFGGEGEGDDEEGGGAGRESVDVEL